MAFVKVATLDDLWSGEMIGVVVEGIPVLLINVEGTLRAYTDICPHLGSPLSRGSFKGRILFCATHGWEFDAMAGCGINPRNTCLESLPLRLEGDDILLDPSTFHKRRTA